MSGQRNVISPAACKQWCKGCSICYSDPSPSQSNIVSPGRRLWSWLMKHSRESVPLSRKPLLWKLLAVHKNLNQNQGNGNGNSGRGSSSKAGKFNNNVDTHATASMCLGFGPPLAPFLQADLGSRFGTMIGFDGAFSTLCYALDDILFGDIIESEGETFRPSAGSGSGSSLLFFSSPSSLRLLTRLSRQFQTLMCAFNLPLFKWFF